MALTPGARLGPYETLGARVTRGSLAVAEAVELLTQIAAGVEVH